MPPKKRAGLLPSSIVYKYAVDVFSASYISGWCFHRFNKSEPLTLVFSSGRTVLGEVRANQLREDLHKQSLHPNGRCGFSFVFPRQQASEQIHAHSKIVVSVKNSGSVLCELNNNLADKVAGRPKHPFSQIKQRLSMARSRHDKVFFMHIPKTAGTTFNTFAKSLYPPDRALTHVEFYDSSEYAQIAQDYHFISGHLNVGQIRQFFPSNKFKFYTLMREPYAHLHSHFNWLRGIGADKGGAFYQSHHHAFRAIADELVEKTTLSHDELQTIVDQLNGLLRNLLENSQTRYFLNESCDRVGEDELEIAKENAALFAHIGSTEQYEQFRAAFCEAHHFKFKQNNNAFNTSQMSALFDHRDPVTQEILFPLVDKDLVLYQLFLDE